MIFNSPKQQQQRRAIMRYYSGQEIPRGSQLLNNVKQAIRPTSTQQIRNLQMLSPQKPQPLIYEPEQQSRKQLQKRKSLGYYLHPNDISLSEITKCFKLSKVKTPQQSADFNYKDLCTNLLRSQNQTILSLNEKRNFVMAKAPTSSPMKLTTKCKIE